MKFNYVLSVVIYTGLTFGATPSQAAVMSLFDYAYNIDGVLTSAPNPTPPGVNGAGFNYSTGLGTITYSFNTPGSHFAGLFVDIEIDEATNTFFNEYGTPVGAPVAGQSWEIDEPGFVFGNIYTNFAGSNATASLLDNSNGVPLASPDDVSMAMGWNFLLSASESALISFNLSTIAPTSGFYLQHTDPASSASVYFSSQVTFIPTGNGSVPEAPTLALIGIALVGMHLSRRKAA